MLARLVEARERGLATMIGSVLSSNIAMLELCRGLGFAVAAEAGDASVFRVTLDLRAAPTRPAPNEPRREALAH